jgi:dolichol-phosphate mannosyltransferase
MNDHPPELAAARPACAATGKAAVEPGGSDVAPELAIVIPTFNEAENIGPLVARLDAALAGLAWEAIFVDDDSPDGTGEIVRDIGKRRENVRCIRRVGRRGLASACIEGAAATAAPYIAVIDADLQHDESLLPKMLGRSRPGGWMSSSRAASSQRELRPIGRFGECGSAILRAVFPAASSKPR